MKLILLLLVFVGAIAICEAVGFFFPRSGISAPFGANSQWNEPGNEKLKGVDLVALSEVAPQSQSGKIERLDKTLVDLWGKLIIMAIMALSVRWWLSGGVAKIKTQKYGKICSTHDSGPRL